MDDPDVIEQMPPAGGNANAPQSGTYGEGVALERLQAQLPSLSGPEGQGPPTPPPMTPGPQPAPAPTGLPGALMAPSTRPEVPVGTPLATPMAPPDPKVAHLEFLKAMVENRDGLYSEVTQQWATTVLDRMLRVVS